MCYKSLPPDIWSGFHWQDLVEWRHFLNLCHAEGTPPGELAGDRRFLVFLPGRKENMDGHWLQLPNRWWDHHHWLEDPADYLKRCIPPALLHAMYGKEKWGVKPEKIKLVEYNLLSDQKAEFLVTEREIVNTRTYIKGSIADMQSLPSGSVSGQRPYPIFPFDFLKVLGNLHSLPCSSLFPHFSLIRFFQCFSSGKDNAHYQGLFRVVSSPHRVTFQIPY